jgi:hypothetical protein
MTQQIIDQIVELRTLEEFREAYPVMKELRIQLDEERYLDLLKEMVGRRGYRLFALRHEGNIVALAGIEAAVDLFFGRYIWLDDLVVSASTPAAYGEQIVKFVEDFARSEGFDTVVTGSGLWRPDVHSFYEEHLGFERRGYVFKKELK